MKHKYILLLVSLLLGCTSGVLLSSPDVEEDVVIGGLQEEVLEDVAESLDSSEAGPDLTDVIEGGDIRDELEVLAEEAYPEEPYSLELFGVIGDMTFYDPWEGTWISLSDYYKHEEHKALFVVSSAGWCGPCLKESAALIDIYETYHIDGLEIVYTLGNTNKLGEVPFKDVEPGTDKYYEHLNFMEVWQLTASDEAGKKFNYKTYADPNREFIKYLPQHAWPLSMLITTKDMGIRLVEEGYWSSLVENKIMLVLYNEVPSIPFN